MKPNLKKDDLIESVIQQIKTIVEKTRDKIAATVNIELLMTYWQIGQIIADRELVGQTSDRSFILELSKKLTAELGKGYSRSNLFNMKNFHAAYPDVQTLSGQISWSHYCELLLVEDPLARSFYEKESVQSNWSVRELRRQIDSSLFERLLLSKGELYRKEVLKMAKEGQSIKKATDILKEPYVLNFLGLLENKPYTEQDLEFHIIRHIEEFLLELGRGFMFVGSQVRIPVGTKFHRIDMVFYNKILKAYVLIDLKRRKLEPADIGQMNFYLNYYKMEVNDADDNEPIGIILCARKDEVVAEYALGGLVNQVFASKYVLYLPDKEVLAKEVQKLLESEDENESR